MKFVNRFFSRKTNPGTAKRLLLLFLIALLIIPQIGCTANTKSSNQGYARTSFCLDTLCEITVYGIETDTSLKKDEYQDRAFGIIGDAFRFINDYEKLLSATIEGSAVSEFNASSGEWIDTDPEVIGLISLASTFSEASGGAFDITIGKASKLWDFHDIDDQGERSGELPEASALSDAVTHVGYEKLEIDETGSRLRKLDPDVEIDLGAIAKGYIADRVCEFLLDAGVTSAVVNLGGNISTLGGKSGSFITDGFGDEAPSAADKDLSGMICGIVSGGSAFTLGVKDPDENASSLLGSVDCFNASLVTSGTYERYFEADGKKYHHVLDPETGYPFDTDVLQVTVIGSNSQSAMCDALSTSCLALGVEKGLELAKSLGFDAIFVNTDGDVIKTREDICFEEW